MFNKIRYTLLSLFTVFKHLFKKPVTLEYPEKKNKVNEIFRGKPILEGCVRCGTCIKVCPTKAISIDGDNFKIDLRRCIFCGNCAFYCSKSAIKMSENYELATDKYQDLQLIYTIGGNNERND